MMIIKQNYSRYLLIAWPSSEVFQGRSQITSTKASDIKCNISIDESVLSPCNHDEAETRNFLHILDCIRNGFNEIKVITADTDVVVIAFGCFYLLRPEKLWIEFGVGKHRRWLPIHTYVNILGESKCAGLLFWYAFTGCDTASSFRGRTEGNGLEYMEFVPRSYRGIY